MGTTKKCPVCGKAYISTNNRQVFCTRKCKDKSRYFNYEPEEKARIWKMPVDNSKEGKAALNKARKIAGLPLETGKFDYNQKSAKARRKELAEVNHQAREQHKTYGEIQAEKYMKNRAAFDRMEHRSIVNEVKGSHIQASDVSIWKE